MKNILFLFVCFPIYSQTLEGFVIDSLTKEPLPYANISFLDNNIGVSADENGFFRLNISNKKSNNVLISFVGYENSIISLEKYTKNQKYTKNIALLATAELLDEVILEGSSKKMKNIQLGTFNRKGIFLTSVPFGYEKAVFIENTTKKIGKIKAVTLYFDTETNELYEQFDAFFKLNFYRVDEDGFPKETISKELFLIKPQNKKL